VAAGISVVLDLGLMRPVQRERVAPPEPPPDLNDPSGEPGAIAPEPPTP